MHDYVYLASSPIEEECAQLGTEGYERRAIAETDAYRLQLGRLYKSHFGVELPETVMIRRERERHDFGTYYSLVARYEVPVMMHDEDICLEDLNRDNPPENGLLAALWLEANEPSNWDDEAKRYIKAALS